MVKINHPKAGDILKEIYNRLSMLEVKGDSVEHVYMCKLGIRELLQTLEEIPLNMEKDKEKEG